MRVNWDFYTTPLATSTIDNLGETAFQRLHWQCDYFEGRKCGVKSSNKKARELSAEGEKVVAAFRKSLLLSEVGGKPTSNKKPEKEISTTAGTADEALAATVVVTADPVLAAASLQQESLAREAGILGRGKKTGAKQAGKQNSTPPLNTEI